MSAYICKVEHPFFAVTDKEGFYSITDVPPGKYEVAVFHAYTHSTHESAGPKTHKLLVTKDQMTEADFVIQAKSR